jgi:hypothetical protein
MDTFCDCHLARQNRKSERNGHKVPKSAQRVPKNSRRSSRRVRAIAEQAGVVVALQLVLMLETVTTARADDGDDGLKPCSAF